MKIRTKVNKGVAINAFLCCTLALLVGVYLGYNDCMRECDCICVCEKGSCKFVYRWQEILWNVSRHSYDRKLYNCWNFSYDACRMLREEGYEAYIVIGKMRPNSTGKHAWVKVCFYAEPQSGVLIEPSILKKGYYKKEQLLSCQRG